MLCPLNRTPAPGVWSEPSLGVSGSLALASHCLQAPLTRQPFLSHLWRVWKLLMAGWEGVLGVLDPLTLASPICHAVMSPQCRMGKVTAGRESDVC